jgi:hypothetical protein
MGQAAFVMMVMGARSYSKEARPRLYPTAHIPAHTPKPGNPQLMGARSKSKEARPRLYPTSHIPAHTPKPGDHFHVPNISPHISEHIPDPRHGANGLPRGSAGVAWTPPPVDPKPPSIRGDMCGDLGDMCVQANLHVYAGSLGICAEIWGYVRPAGWVCAARGSMCAGFWGYVRDMCVR